jgi:hypothetical protein
MDKFEELDRRFDEEVATAPALRRGRRGAGNGAAHGVFSQGCVGKSHGSACEARGAYRGAEILIDAESPVMKGEAVIRRCVFCHLVQAALPDSLFAYASYQELVAAR